MPRRLSRAAPALVALLVAATAVPTAGAAGAARLPCTGDASTLQPLTLDVGGVPATGHLVAPRRAPTAAVIMGHGYSFASDGWLPHLRRAAAGGGALAVAMDYRGLVDLGDDPKDTWPYRRSRGYPVKAGSEDLVAAAQAALRDCPTIGSVVLVGTSMGGNATGLAVALKARRPDGTPLFDYWIGIEGVYDLTQLYELARAGQAISPFVAQVKQDIELETGGTVEQQPAAYAERTVVQRVGDIAAAGLKGIAFVHAEQDGLALYPQAQQMVRAVRDRGVPTDFYTVGTRGPQDDPDTTVGGYASVDTGGAGHGPEVSEHHVVIDEGMAVLQRLLAGDPPPCGRDLRVEGAPALSVTPDPARATAACPRGPVLSTSGPPVTACRPTLPKLAGLSARRLAGGRVTVRGRVVRGACPPRSPRLRVTLVAGSRTVVVRTRGGGRFTATVRTGATRLTLTPSDRDRRGRARTLRV